MGVIIFSILILSTLVALVNIKPTEAASGSYYEDFTTLLIISIAAVLTTVLMKYNR